MCALREPVPRRFPERGGTLLVGCVVGVGLQLASDGRDLGAVGEYDDVSEERSHPGHPLWSSVAYEGPSGQLVHGDERDGERLAGELAGQRVGYSSAKHCRGGVGVEDYEGHATSERREA